MYVIKNKGVIWNPSNCEWECDKSCDIGEYLDYSNYKSRKKIVDKLVVEQYTENIEETRLLEKMSAEIENKYSSSTLYIVLFSIFFTISIGIGIYFVYSCWYFKKIFHVLSLIVMLRQQFIECNSIELINGKSKEISMKNQSYYFFDDIIDIRNFHSNLLIIDKTSHEELDIYYITYITSKTFSDCENIHNVNPLYLIIHSATEHFKEKKIEKYFILDSTEKYQEAFSGIKSEIETINGGTELFYENNYARIGVNTDDDLPLKKALTFPNLAIIVRCVF